MLAIGLMSGTSFDGVDASLIQTDGIDKYIPIHNCHLPYTEDFQKQLRHTCELSNNNWLFIENALTIHHAKCVKHLLEKSNTKAADVDVIGFHGQTLYHNPDQGLTWQIGNPHLLSRLTDIKVVHDFRRRDMAFGGQGAPLVPIFHKCLMATINKPVALINIGGIANISYIDSDELIAFDTGPGCCLINDAMMRYYNRLYDQDGLIASSGSVNQDILNKIMNDQFFKIMPPKSLDRNYFEHYNDLFAKEKHVNIVTTLTKLTVESISISIGYLPKYPGKIYLCGGGSYNMTIVQWLKDEINVDVENISSLNIDPNFVESQSFGYIAVRYIKNLPSSFPSTTASLHPVIAGVIS